MNKRIKKKRKLERTIVMLVAENAMQAEALRNQNKEIMELKSIVQRNALATNEELATVKAATLDNQSAIKSIGDDVDYIKQNYKRKWRRNNMVLEQAELEMVRNQRLVMINPEMVTITKTEYDLLIEIKNKFLES